MIEFSDLLIEIITLFLIKGIKRFLPYEIFIQKINLDAISALIILEDYLNFKFEVNSQIESKTWMKP